jgi:hypothetical protein
MSAWEIADQEFQKKHLKNCSTEDGHVERVITYAVDGAINPLTNTAKLTKGSAGAYTLAAPTIAQEGHILTIVSDSAYAHVVTATGLINDGVTGGAKNTATFAAFAGASIMLQAINQKWAVLNKNVVTVA